MIIASVTFAIVSIIVVVVAGKRKLLTNYQIASLLSKHVKCHLDMNKMSAERHKYLAKKEKQQDQNRKKEEKERLERDEMKRRAMAVYSKMKSGSQDDPTETAVVTVTTPLATTSMATAAATPGTHPPAEVISTA